MVRKESPEYFNYTETYFSGLVNSISELSEALKRGRRPLETMVENSLFKRAFGGIKIKTQVRRFLEEKCECEGRDKKCDRCKGTGKKLVTDIESVQETVTELPPDTGAAAFWLKQKKPEIWNKQPLKHEMEFPQLDKKPEIRVNFSYQGKPVDKNELNKIEASENENGEKRSGFDELRLLLSKNIGYALDPDKITVKEFALTLKQYRKEIEAKEAALRR